MRLTEQERALLAGDDGYAARKSMEILVALGEIFGAEEMVPVRSVQVSGVSYHNLGDAGLEWLEEMAVDGRVRALTTLNPAGMDLEAWREQGIDPAFADKQLRVVDAYTALGIARTCTCTPYLIGNLPAPGEHVAWAESSAVAYANSVLGARTNREGGPSALAAAIVGRTPLYGLHLDTNRIPTVEVTVDAPLVSTADWGALGALLGRRGNGEIPLIHMDSRPGVPELKSLGAAVVTFGGSPLFYLAGLTAAPPSTAIGRHLTIDAAAIDELLASLDDGAEQVDLVCLGCPHASLAELEQLARLLDGSQVATELWICTARPTALAAAELGLTARIEGAGARIVCDTCFAVTPVARPGITVATDSAKGCFYGRGHNKLRVHIGSVERCVQAALSGRWS